MSRIGVRAFLMMCQVHERRTELLALHVDLGQKQSVIQNRENSLTRFSNICCSSRLCSVDGMPSKFNSPTPRSPLSGVLNSREMRFRNSLLELSRTANRSLAGASSRERAANRGNELLQSLGSGAGYGASTGLALFHTCCGGIDLAAKYLSGTQTRRIGGLVDIYPEPRIELHPRLAEKHEIADRDWVAVTTRRDQLTLRALVVRTIRPDTIFIPYHWANQKSANKLTHRTLDPRSKIPEFKVSACRIHKAERVRKGCSDVRLRVHVDTTRCIGCQSCLKACEECETHRGL